MRGDRVALARRGMSLDLDALGKGFAIDEIRRALRGRGPSGLLNFGESSLVPLGAASGRGGTVMIRHPRGGFVGAIQLRRRSTQRTAAAASRAGDGAAPSAAVAEAVSTAMLVAGRDAMPGLARRFGVDACWVEGTVVVTTPGFHLHRLEGALPPASRG